MAKPPANSFAARLGYLRWLRVMETGVFENATEFAAFAGVNYALYMKWQDSLVAPPQRATAKSFLSAGLVQLGATEGWLLDGEGHPPRPDLWTVWANPTSKRGTIEAKPRTSGRRAVG